jgi:hypothetical protein
MAAGSTYTPIATTTLGSAAASYTFSSISGSYTDLILVISGTTTVNGAGIIFTFNGDTASNYSLTYMRGSGTAAVSGRVTSINSGYLSYGAGFSSTQISNGIMQVQNYSNTTTYKTTINRVNNAAGSLGQGTEATVNLWRSTSAITSIALSPDSGNLGSGMSLTLYGIAAA